MATTLSGVVAHAETSACTPGVGSTAVAALGSTDWIAGRIRIDGTPRDYVASVPAAARTRRPTPLILAFHGRNLPDVVFAAITGLSTLPALVVYPQAAVGPLGTAWEGAPYASRVDDVHFAADLIDEMSRRFCVDPDRVYATGLSNGGGMAALLACALPDRIAAVAPVAGAYYENTERGCTDHSPEVPIVEFHGTGDTTVAYSGGVEFGSRYTPVESWVTRWAVRDRCGGGPIRTRVSPMVTEFDWPNCAHNAEVVHYVIDGGGHTWPGSSLPSGPGVETTQVSATALMWSFFGRHRLSDRR
ncbi:alpha/beta hydrolase family esterase [Williamsia sterculiae]|uniref:alpha/beta hydrolase family esterase n=1 Tax=Williamsia sterculiae TaxID=1344003 RepID=UPI0013564657|nr:PHB depolymerase family esterase [Williamsia sterculiae]